MARVKPATNKSMSGTASTAAKKRTPANPEALRKFVRARAEELLEDKNITSVGIALAADGTECIQFTVAKKADENELEALGTRLIPRSFNIDGVDVRTDVVQRQYKTSQEILELRLKGQRKQRRNPIVPGISVSHPTGTAGTLGAIVFDRRTGAPCVLSNWHVLHTPGGTLGDPMVQPGPHDDNRVNQNQAGFLVRSHLGVAGDCAIARIDGREFDLSVEDLGVKISKLARPHLGDVVVKSGRTTAVTHGIVRRVDVTAKLNYGGDVGTKLIGGFEIGPPTGARADYEVSMGGDSGAAWLVGEKKDGVSVMRDGVPVATDVMVGLHFAGESNGETDEHALACYAHSVFEKLEIDIAEPDPKRHAETLGSGYASGFLGTSVPVPVLPAAKMGDAVKLGAKTEIPYTHFSVCMSRSRRFAHFVAWNIDGKQLKAFGRKGLKFKLDKRIDEENQAGDDIYVDNNLDRGHIARRADLVWGPDAEAQQANRDSFYFTNITPQHAAFNQSSQGGLWGELENAIFEEVDVTNLKLSVIGGPVFTPKDPGYRGIKIPRSFWKLIAYVEEGQDALKVKAYVLTQNDLLNDIEAFDLDPFRLYQVGVDELAKLIKMQFDEAIVNADTFAHQETLALENVPKRNVREVRLRRELVTGR